jgi:hypothetical protein
VDSNLGASRPDEVQLFAANRGGSVEVPPLPERLLDTLSDANESPLGPIRDDSDSESPAEMPAFQHIVHHQHRHVKAPVTPGEASVVERSAAPPSLAIAEFGGSHVDRTEERAIGGTAFEVARRAPVLAVETGAQFEHRTGDPPLPTAPLSSPTKSNHSSQSMT